jgi:ADP-ribose pyrophosphatase
VITLLKKWRVLAEKNVFRTKWLSIRQETCEIHNGKIIDDYFIIEGGHVALVFALTPDKKVVLVRQYKHGIREIVLEIPAGGIHDDEAPEVGARRELLEETGYVADEFVLVATHIRSPSKSAILDYVYLAKDAYPTGATQFDEAENIEVELATLDELRKLLHAGEIRDLGGVAAIYQVLDYLDRLG